MRIYKVLFLIILILENVLLLFSQHKKNQYIEKLQHQIFKETVESSQFNVL